jgi:hypothetical protein
MLQWDPRKRMRERERESEGWDVLFGKVTAYIPNDRKQIKVEVRFFRSLLPDWISGLSHA